MPVQFTFEYRSDNAWVMKANHNGETRDVGLIADDGDGFTATITDGPRRTFKDAEHEDAQMAALNWIRDEAPAWVKEGV